MAKYRKAILKALIDLDGKATNQQIYEQVKKYIVVEGQTPNNTIRRELQELRSKGYLTKKDNVDGVWEIRDFMGEIKYGNNRINQQNIEFAERNDIIEYQKSQLTPTAMFEKLAVQMMDSMIEHNSDKEDRKKARDSLKDMMTYLKITPSPKLHDRIIEFGNEEQKKDSTNIENNYYAPYTHNEFKADSKPILHQS